MLQNERLLALTRWLLSETGQEDLLIGHSYAQYRRILGRTCDRIGLRDLHFTPHSPRSGFATELFAQGAPFDRIKALVDAGVGLLSGVSRRRLATEHGGSRGAAG